MNKSVFFVALLGAFALGVGSQFFWPGDPDSTEPSDSAAGDERAPLLGGPHGGQLSPE